jgi:hypothetical protein
MAAGFRCAYSPHCPCYCARPQIMRLERDAEGENSFFTTGQDYKETDTSGMAIPDFRMSVVSMGATPRMYAYNMAPMAALTCISPMARRRPGSTCRQRYA